MGRLNSGLRSNLIYVYLTSGQSLDDYFQNNQEDNTVIIVACSQYVEGFPTSTASGIVISQKNNALWGTQLAIYNGQFKGRGYNNSVTPSDWTAL